MERNSNLVVFLCLNGMTREVCDKTKQKSTKHIGLYDTESSLLDILKPMYITNLDLENANVRCTDP